MVVIQMVNKTKSSGELVTALYQSLKHGTNQVNCVPGLLKQVIQESAWERYSLPHSSVIHTYENFKEFADKWLCFNIDDLKAICTSRSDYEALDLLDKITTGRQGERTDLVDNINEVSRPTGTSNTCALRKLRKDRPDLHSQVIAGEISPHAAMVQAGFRRKQATIIIEPKNFINAILKHFDEDQRQEVKRGI